MILIPISLSNLQIRADIEIARIPRVVKVAHAYPGVIGDDVVDVEGGVEVVIIGDFEGGVGAAGGGLAGGEAAGVR